MAYKAEIDIDDDRWCKHPYGITIYDDNGNQVDSRNWLDSRSECYKLSDTYGIPRNEVSERLY